MVRGRYDRMSEASEGHHRGMANQYLYNATRSLAAADGQLEQFKKWAADLGELSIRTNDFLTALAAHHAGQPWPWEVQGAVLAKANARDVATVVLEAINAAGLEAHETGDEHAEEIIAGLAILIRAVLGISPTPANVGGFDEGDSIPGPQSVRQEADKADEPGTGGSPGP